MLTVKSLRGCQSTDMAYKTYKYIWLIAPITDMQGNTVWHKIVMGNKCYNNKTDKFQFVKGYLSKFPNLSLFSSKFSLP